MNYTSMKQKANSGAHAPFTIGNRFPVQLTDGRTVEIAYIGKNKDNMRSNRQWTRSLCSGSSYIFVYITPYGPFSSADATYTFGVAPCFAI